MTANTVMQSADVARAITRIAHEILESNRGSDNLVLLGIPTRGVTLADRIAAAIHAIDGADVPRGSLDVTMYRDDLQSNPLREPSPTAASMAAATVAGQAPGSRDSAGTRSRAAESRERALSRAGSPVGGGGGGGGGRACCDGGFVGSVSVFAASCFSSSPPSPPSSVFGFFLAAAASSASPSRPPPLASRSSRSSSSLGRRFLSPAGAEVEGAEPPPPSPPFPPPLPLPLPTTAAFHSATTRFAAAATVALEVELSLDRARTRLPAPVSRRSAEVT